MILNNSENNKSTTSTRTEDYIGNNKRYSISENKHHVRIIGNENKIYLSTNSGTIEVIGNSTVVRIMNNRGPMVYTGNNGKIYLCNDSPVKSVKYTGCNGSIKLVPRDEVLVKKTAKLRSSSPLQKNHLSQDDCSNLFDKKFMKFTENDYFGVRNESMPNLRSFHVNVCNSVIKIAQSNIIINRQ